MILVPLIPYHRNFFSVLIVYLILDCDLSNWVTQNILKKSLLLSFRVTPLPVSISFSQSLNLGYAYNRFDLSYARRNLKTYGCTIDSLFHYYITWCCWLADTVAMCPRVTLSDQIDFTSLTLTSLCFCPSMT